MQSAHNQVAGIGSGKSYGHRFQISYFSQQNHIGILSQSMPEGGYERFGIPPYFPLGDYAFFVTMYKLNRILYG